MTANPILNMLSNFAGGGLNNSPANMQNGSSGLGGLSGAKINGILDLYNSLKGSSNPMQTLKSMAQFNPNIQKAMDYIDQSGGDTKSAFYKLAEQQGIDPNKILNLIK